jgi:L-threonylcarbamoyladenylate synthase
LTSDILACADLVLDAGELDGGVGSTVVDATGEEPLILREGGVASEEIFAAARGD